MLVHVLAKGHPQKHCQVCWTAHMDSEPRGDLEAIFDCGDIWHLEEYPWITHKQSPCISQLILSTVKLTEGSDKKNSFLITQILRQTRKIHGRDICGFCMPSPRCAPFLWGSTPVPVWLLWLRRQICDLVLVYSH